ncbi:osmoprotectant transport system substrate-binding protein [Rhodococcus wratislaviensis]|uniref:ABC transporter substrate-binding protein n=2 Tax=Rhodococcus TaxID=1827 RepID=A0AB38FE67_RHOWR|nr:MULTISPECIES: ABC transporter substrate-binding protein [Rhodococcus]AII08571.1 glycine/betaine ABC transporter substrate-binding protein [Rhodococcus opacus]MDI9948256.1 glycine betaine ABC transporter substrate-binding protein [Rhodococcus sp. IEGM 1305]REE75138.1 osmoprotectant transport system substrate-binding protein [Rhodococcus wratislaviensis]WAM12790.1 glycine/betaine ABC transporter substrate-binding protein [Rhodococcus sp. JS3073]SPZ39834.1 ABC transporter substrate-binding pro
MKKALIVALTGATLMSLTACGIGKDPLASDDGGSSDGAIVVGSADFPESQLIATIYAEALRANGIDVTEKLNIGSREVYVPAIRDGSIDLLPEYSGALLQYLDSATTATASDEVTAEIKAKLPAGLVALEPSPAEDKDVLAVRQETADEYSLETIEDLVPHADELTLGGPPEWKTRENGVAGLRDKYGLTFKEFLALDAGGPLTLNALLSGQIEVADVFSTDPAMRSENLVALEDTKHLFLAENITPIINENKAGDDVRGVLADVSAALTTEDLIEMNQRVADLEDMGDIAREWLQDKGLAS